MRMWRPVLLEIRNHRPPGLIAMPVNAIGPERHARLVGIAQRGDDALAGQPFGIAEGLDELDKRSVLDDFGAEKHSRAAWHAAAGKASAGIKN